MLSAASAPRFIQAYEKPGIPIWGLTVQNEPMAAQTWESCLYTAEAERDFVKTHLGPRLREDGLQDKQIIVWDHHRTLMYERARVVLDDPEAKDEGPRLAMISASDRAGGRAVGRRWRRFGRGL